MTGELHIPDGLAFADITDEADAILAEPQTAEFIESQRPAPEAMDRTFAMNLAIFHKAAELTQKDIAAAIGRYQSYVTKMEPARTCCCRPQPNTSRPPESTLPPSP